MAKIVVGASPNNPPAQPANVSPSNGTTGLSLTPTLQSSAFSDPNAGDTHAASQWQVRTSTGSYSSPAYDSGTIPTNLTSITVPSGELSHSTTYFWRVSHQDHHGAWSTYSNETSFSTVGAPSANSWAVIVGVADYQYFSTQGTGDLNYTDDDAQGLYNVLSPIWGASHIKLILNSQATKAGIQTAISSWLDPLEDSDDTVLFFFSGHGDQTTDISPLDELDQLDETICPYDALPAYTNNDIYDDELSTWLGSLESGRQVVILNGCYTGGFISQAGRLNPTSPGPDPSDGFAQDLSRSGRVILTGGEEDESTWEDPALGRSVFPYYILEAFDYLEVLDSNSNNAISAEELFYYAQPRTVNYEVTNYFETIQHPQMYDGYAGELTLITLATVTIDANPRTSAVTLDGQPYSASQLPAVKAFMPGTNSTFSFSVSTLVEADILQPRYEFSSWNDGALTNTRTVTISTSASYVATYMTQYYLGVESEYGNPQGEAWYDMGAGADFSVPAVVDLGNGTRHVFTAWSGASTADTSSTSVVMDSPKSAAANWRTEYRLTVQSQYGSPQGGGWYAANATATFSVPATVELADGSRSVFTDWTGSTNATSASSSLPMNSPKSITASWKLQYRLSVIVDPSEASSPSADGWYDKGATATVSMPETVTADTGTRYFLSGWMVDKSREYGNPLGVTMNASHTVVAEYALQYYLSVESDRGNPQGAGWYTEGAQATASVESPIGMVVRQVFDGWSGDSLHTTKVANLLMDSPKSVTATWRTDYTQLLVLLGVVAAVAAAGLAAVLVVMRRR